MNLLLQRWGVRSTPASHNSTFYLFSLVVLKNCTTFKFKYQNIKITEFTPDLVLLNVEPLLIIQYIGIVESKGILNMNTIVFVEVKKDKLSVSTTCVNVNRNSWLSLEYLRVFMLFVANIELRVYLILYPFLGISLGSAANRIPNDQFVRRPQKICDTPFIVE